VVTARDHLTRVLPWVLFQSFRRPLHHEELPEAWAALAIRADAQGLTPCLLYESRHGRRLVRLPTWIGKPGLRVPNFHHLTASQVLDLPRAERLLRIAADDRRHLARLWIGAISAFGPACPGPSRA
jgi:hypothetical protein